MPKAAQNFGLIAFAIVLFDSMFTYFLRPFFGVKEVPVNVILPIIVFLMIMLWGLTTINVRRHVRIALVIGFTGFLAGVVFLPEFNLFRIPTIVTALCAFFIGHFSARWSDNVDMYSKTFAIVGIVYLCICILALHNVYPRLFPIVNSIGYYWGTPIERPQITIDQNFQFFYLFPVILILALPFRLIRFLAGFGGLIGGLYVLNRLQTRSGFLILIGATVLCLLAPLFSEGLGRKKTIIIPLVILVLVLLSFDLILKVGQPIIFRFFEKDFNTLDARIVAFKYLLEHLFNPIWWFPHGNAQFRMMGGGLPHFTPTAFFLEAGIFGLYMWVIVFFSPLIYLTRMLLKGELDALATILLIGGISSFIGQLSLNAPLYEHVWLWAGAVLGTLDRQKEKISNQEKNQVGQDLESDHAISGIPFERQNSVSGSGFEPYRAD
jgi:hypothetical protein